MTLNCFHASSPSLGKDKRFIFPEMGELAAGKKSALDIRKKVCIPFPGFCPPISFARIFRAGKNLRLVIIHTRPLRPTANDMTQTLLSPKYFSGHIQIIYSIYEPSLRGSLIKPR